MKKLFGFGLPAAACQLNMMNQQSDFELLRRFVRHADQSAFGTVVRRHLDLVYATALRKVEDTGAAEEIAQNVFTALARKAWQFAPDDSLPAWLHRTALLESKSWWRGELRRRRREQTAIELGTTMKTSDEQAALRTLTPLLDEALLSLREKDRSALLLRFYERRSLHEVGAALGIREDAAQKRVASALERVASFFQRRGFKTATVAATARLLEHTAATAPASAASLVVNTALHGVPAFSGIVAWLTRITSLSKAQTAVVCVVLSASPLAWQWNEYRHTRAAASHVEAQLTAGQTAFFTLQTEIDTLRANTARLDAMRAEESLAAQHRAESRQRHQLWKAQLRDRLLGPDYGWPDDSALVRIPKSVLPKVKINRLIAPPGVIARQGREFLGLTPREREQAEDALHNHFAALEDLMRANFRETNTSQRIRVPETALASRVFAVPALGEEVKAQAQALQDELKALLGAERWRLVEPQLASSGTDTLRRVLNLDAGERRQEMAVWIREDQGKLVAGFGWDDQRSMFTSSGVALELFLPNATFVPDSSLSTGTRPFNEVSAEEYAGFRNLPSALTKPALAWLRTQAENRLEKKDN
jgi:RNA polymerase sigma factor (sigma-70 family)